MKTRREFLTLGSLAALAGCAAAPCRSENQLDVNGIRFGVIGMVTPNIARWSCTQLAGCAVTDPLEETRRIIRVHYGNYPLSLAEDYFRTVAGLALLQECRVIGHLDLLTKFN